MEQKRAQELLKEKLKENGLKVTQQRILVLQTLANNSGSHMTAEEIYGLIREKHPDIGLATVYRTLQLFLEMQLAESINLDDGCVRYEIGHIFEGDMKHNHHHLICGACGKVFPFEDDLLDGLEDQIEKATGFHVLDHKLKFYGLCKDCLSKSK